MPELPEVETVRRGLQPVMENARFVKVEVRRPDLRFPFPQNFNKRLEGQSVVGLGRREDDRHRERGRSEEEHGHGHGHEERDHERGDR